MSGACCTIPPVEAEYTPKGDYVDFTGVKSYVVGPEDTGKAILFVYDVFGFSPQILQGADLLAAAGFRIVMPDFLLGKYAQKSFFDGSEEGTKAKNEYFSTFPGGVHTQSEPIGKAGKALKDAGYSVGAIGFCWGWKAQALCESINEFTAIGSAHPSFADPSDAEKITVPVCLLPSSGEDKTAVNGLYSALEAARPGKNFIQWYDDMPHGWTAARGDLSGGPATEAFRDAYVKFADFFAANL